MSHCRGQDVLSFADMKRQAHSYAKTQLGLDRSFCLELSFLSEIAEGLAKEQLHHAVFGRVAQ